MSEARLSDPEADDDPSVMGAGCGMAPMPTLEDGQAAFRELYIARMVVRGIDKEDAERCFDAVGFDPKYGFDITDDPEWVTHG